MTQKFFLLTSTIFKSKEMFYYYEFYIILSISRISISFLRLIIYVSVLSSQNKKKTEKVKIFITEYHYCKEGFHIAGIETTYQMKIQS